MKENFTTSRNIRMAITSYCNLDCKYCGGHKGYSFEKRGTMEDYRRDVIDGYQLKLKEIKELLEKFYKVGYRGISLTGGEPLLNNRWYEIIQYCKKLGFERREITTNGVLLKDYIEKNGYPTDVTLIKISFDTIDSSEFFKITGRNQFEKVVESIKIVTPVIDTRANRVVLKSELSDLDNFIQYCKQIGFKSTNLLDLVYYPNRRVAEEKAYFENEYVPAIELKKYLEKKYNYKFIRNKYGYECNDAEGFKIILKESRLTLRDKQCDNCPIYCQEGKFTTRIATDGNITMCPDCYCELPSISGRDLVEGKLEIEVLKKLYDSIDKSEEYDTFDKFLNKYNLKIGGKNR